MRSRAGTLGVTSHYLTLFPNFVMGTYQPDQMGVHLNEPLSCRFDTPVPGHLLAQGRGL